MERPIGVAILNSMVRSALRARRRQYQTRDLLQRLEEADRHKDLFLATLSHELRTPLTAMVGWVRLLKKGLLDAPMAAHALDVIERSVGAQTQLIQDILSVSRIITGKFQIQMDPVDLTLIVSAAIDAIWPTAKTKNLRIETAFDPRSIAVTGDSVRLQQIVWNLLSNAIKFTPPDGVIEVQLGASEGWATVAVRDSGQGITPGFLPHVFERFRQADSSYTRSAGGLGLGLAIVRHLAELHGGSVHAASAGPDQGATFTVKLPIYGGNVPLVAGHRDDSQALPPNDLSGLRVLLVEDDAESREVLTAILQNCGAEVHAAACASEALRLSRSQAPHVIASDIGLPDQDGFELMRQIRAAEGQHPPVPAIALTGFASEDDIRRALAAGYQQHLAKPIDPDDLIRVIGCLTARRSPSPAGSTPGGTPERRPR